MSDNPGEKADHLIELHGGPNNGEKFRWPELPPAWNVPTGGGWYIRELRDAPGQGYGIRYWWRQVPAPTVAELMGAL